MHRLVVASLAAGGLSIGAASAADLGRPVPTPVYTKAPIVVPFSWTGFYVGGTAGGEWSKADVDLNTVNGPSPLYSSGDIPMLNAIGSTDVKASNAIFGGKAGYNQQWGSVVLGIEGDLSWFRVNKSAITTGNPFPECGCGSPAFATFNTNVSTSWLATVRPRVGYAADHALFYATGGAAFSKVSFSNTYVGFSPFGSGLENEASSASQTKTGWAAGAGVDYAVTRNWILSAEYLHVDLGSINAAGVVTTGNPNTATLNFSTKLQSDIVRGGVAYKF
jgi:outer membrane immunogenic protein